MNDDQIFEEKQRFTQWWIRIIFFALNGLFIYGMVQQLVFKEPFGSKPMSDLGLILMSIIFIAFTIIFSRLQLQTRITKDDISVRFIPFHKTFRTFSMDSISYCFIREYNPLLEYGGWGIRGFKANRAFNVSGKKGLQIIFKNGDKLLIGTANSEQLGHVLEVNGLIKKQKDE